ncbi:hypothetical protein J6590_100133 [Homalodisca vitripennis]|nr:hypothetical protein J6590_100133 [Homalodisca vitripennis]
MSVVISMCSYFHRELNSFIDELSRLRRRAGPSYNGVSAKVSQHVRGADEGLRWDERKQTTR